MYEDLKQIATLRINKAVDRISAETREAARQKRNEIAARAGSSGLIGGEDIASVAEVQIDGSERLVRAVFEVWTELIERKSGKLSRPDVGFIGQVVSDYARTQAGHLKAAFSNQNMGSVTNLVNGKADVRMQAVAARLRGDLEITVRENELFSTQQISPAKAEIPPQAKARLRNVLNIVIASPSDVKEEREIVTSVIYDWNATHSRETNIILQPLKWESHSYPASGERPQAIINKQFVEEGDILIGIFGYKLGTPTGVSQSGTIEEIEVFRKSGKYVALYFSTANFPREADLDQLKRLVAYKEERKTDTLYSDFETVDDLREALTKHLPNIVRTVRGQLGLLPLQQHPTSNSIAVEVPTKSKEDQTQNRALLADIVSELEDNLDCAQRPQTGATYRRPSTQAWLESRNKIELPPEIYSQIKNTYGRIKTWADIVSSGLHPTQGSMELNLIVSDLRQSLPSLIESIRKAASQS
jgi:hypothetical protein